MPFSYEYNVNLQSYRLTPITKRLPVRLAFLQCIADTIQRDRDLFFEDYLNGNSDAAWDISTAYVRYDRVNYQNRVYECVQDNTGELPTSRDYWVQILSDFRGATERIKYNCQTIILEWILNKWFGTDFRQPSTGLDSDFYIVNNVRTGNQFTSYATPEVSGVYVNSVSYQFAALASSWVYATPQYSTGANFTVFYPASVIPSTSDEKYFQMTSLINKYTIFGASVEYTSY